MKYRKLKKAFLGIAFLLTGVLMSCSTDKEFTISNPHISRTIKVEGGKLYTTAIDNKRLSKTLTPQDKMEFKLRLSQGTHLEDTDVELSSEDFTFVKVLKEDKSALGFLLENKTHQLQVEVYYTLSGDDFYTRKHLTITAAEDLTLERVDIETVALSDIYQPYQIQQITAQGPAKWRPGLGQPLYTQSTAAFLGVEFPAASNAVKDGRGYCGYLWGKTLQAGKPYTTYPAVVGVGDHAAYIQETFYQYIDQVRIRPLRLQVQYNSWFDFWNGVDKNKFAGSVTTVHQELVAKRGVPPLRAYVIDDGWQDVQADWSDKTWKVNAKFDPDFATSKSSVENAQSTLGLWMSPGCLFGAQPAAKKYKEQGFEVLNNWMSMAGPKYMQLLEDRIIELTRNGVTYFKLDGVFGHLNIREFELHGDRYGIPHMPQLGVEGMTASDERLNDPKYDELKTYYLVAGTERLMQLFEKQHEVNPDVYVVISNGAYLSPWWLMYIDAVWMINAGDAAGGSNRTQELVYRDGVYYDTWQTEKTQFPIHSVFNHEPKKVKTGESAEKFAEYLWMNLSRGTGFIELYIKTQQLSETDWDVLADGLKWAHKVFPYFKRAKMHGGNPSQNDVYGYTAWNENGGYISIHNPSDQQQTYAFSLDRKMGVIPGTKKYTLSSPLENMTGQLGNTFTYGDDMKIDLLPGQVKILEFQ